jgi:hypothetical protein
MVTTAGGQALDSRSRNKPVIRALLDASYFIVHLRSTGSGCKSGITGPLASLQSS